MGLRHLLMELDTPVLLLHAADAGSLSRTARGLLDDQDNEILVSQAGILAMAFDMGANRLQMRIPLRVFIKRHVEANHMRILPITDDHIYPLAEMDFAERDPIRSLIAAQCLAEGIPLVTDDFAFADCPIDVIY